MNFVKQAGSGSESGSGIKPKAGSGSENNNFGSTTQENIGKSAMATGSGKEKGNIKGTNMIEK